MSKNNHAFQIIYLAFGDFFFAQALLSAYTASHFNPSASIKIVTNITVESHHFISLLPDNLELQYINAPDSDNRKYKTHIIEFSDVIKTIYIDSDTFVTAPLDDIVTFLDYWDIALRYQDDPQRHTFLNSIRICGNKLNIASAPHWNAGVLAFRNSTVVHDFFDVWRELFIKSGLEFDQVSLVDSIFNCSTRVLTLDRRWNSGFKRCPSGTLPYIVHYHSMYDHVLEAAIKRILNLMVSCQVISRTSPSFSYIKRKKRVRIRNEFFMYHARLLYRFIWHIRYQKISSLLRSAFSQ